MDFDCPRGSRINWIVDLPKITPMAEFEVINRFVNVDGTNKMAHLLEVMFFCRCRWHTFRFYAHNTGILILWYYPFIFYIP